MNPNEIKNFHLIAICGTGMASLAGLLVAQGHRVTGSDNNIYPPMSTLLEQLGIEVKPGYKKENISPDIDVVVIGNAISKTNEEAQAAEAADCEVLSFPQTLARYFLEGKQSCVVAGTHGKTTTTSLLSWTLFHAGRDPGFMVGGWLKNFDTNHRYGSGQFFIVEGDEYDTAYFDKGPKFLHYQPHAAILTGIEFDHADIYDNLDQILAAFEKFVGIVKPEGFLLVSSTDENALRISRKAASRVESYGFSEEADWAITQFSFSGGRARFTLRNKQASAGEFELPMSGRHNIENAAAVAALCLNLGLTAQEVAAAFAAFKGIRRRQEVVGQARGITVIDDFAHHPTAIDLTLEGLRGAWPGRRLWAVFEPRSATSRRKVFQERFAACFGHADQVVLAAPFDQEKIPEEDRLDAAQLVSSIQAHGTAATLIDDVDGIVDHIAQNARDGDVVAIMSSGGFGGIHQKLLQRIESVAS